MTLSMSSRVIFVERIPALPTAYTGNAWNGRVAPQKEPVSRRGHPLLILKRHSLVQDDSRLGIKLKLKYEFRHHKQVRRPAVRWFRKTWRHKIVRSLGLELHVGFILNSNSTDKRQVLLSEETNAEHCKTKTTVW